MKNLNVIILEKSLSIKIKSLFAYYNNTEYHLYLENGQYKKANCEVIFT